MKTLMISILLAIFISGCLPMPHYESYSPTISGIVTQNGIPVENAQISISSRSIEDTQTTITDSTGHFLLIPIKEFSIFAILIGDPIYDYSMQIIVDNKKYEAYSDGGTGGPPNTLQLNCDLSHPINYSKSQQIYCSTIPDDRVISLHF